MLGYPGAGKTTTAEMIARLTGAVHLASDRIRLELFPHPQFSPKEHQHLYNFIDQRTEELLRTGHSVIYDANLNHYIHRQEKYAICKRIGAQPVLLWVQVDENLARQRATKDGNGDDKRPYGNLDGSTFTRLVREIEPPAPNEPYLIVDGTKVSEPYIKELLTKA